VQTLNHHVLRRKTGATTAKRTAAGFAEDFSVGVWTAVLLAIFLRALESTLQGGIE